MRTETIDYSHQDTELQAFAAYKDTEQKRPAILICHAWAGRDQFVQDKALALANLGFVGIAIDVYGKGKLGKNNEENNALMTPLMQNRSLLRDRLKQGYNLASQHPQVDQRKIAAIGFCFGGLCALDLARSGADLRGVVSFHGLLQAPDTLKNETIKAKILLMHGHDDPMVTPELLLSFETEMTKAGVDWQAHVFGNTQHAFTNPNAHDIKLGLIYQEMAAERSWNGMKSFFNEIFS